MKRAGSWALGCLLAASWAPAIAGSAYTKCLDDANPSGCIARRAVGSFGLESGEVLEGILRHGLVDLVPGKSGKLIRGLYAKIGEPGAKMDSPEAQLLDSTASAALRASPRKSLLAAMALVAAARHEADPFANAVYLKLAHQAKDDPRIPALAMGLWIEVVGMSGSPPDFWVTHAGLPAIWDHAVARKEQDATLLEDMAGTLAFLHELEPQAKEYFLWYAKRLDLTPQRRATTAFQIARKFDMPELAETLLEGIGEVEGYDMNSVRSGVAEARLAKGYDAASARRVTGAIFDDLARDGIRFAGFEDEKRDALERGGARDELRELGAEYLRQAEAIDGKPESANWYAMASDYYLRAGDRDRAREIARRGLPYAPELVRRFNETVGVANKSDPTAAAISAQGRGTLPVVALYRAGAIEEALKTRYLTGKDRYLNAERAGEKKDPQWVLDDDWPLWIGVMVRDASRSTDREFQQRAYDGLVRSCRKPLADCFSETLREIAQVVAGMGDEPRMKEALSAAARQLDAHSFSGFSALYIAGPWAHCEEVLREAMSRK